MPLVVLLTPYNDSVGTDVRFPREMDMGKLGEESGVRLFYTMNSLTFRIDNLAS